MGGAVGALSTDENSIRCYGCGLDTTQLRPLCTMCRVNAFIDLPLVTNEHEFLARINLTRVDMRIDTLTNNTGSNWILRFVDGLAFHESLRHKNKRNARCVRHLKPLLEGDPLLDGDVCAVCMNDLNTAHGAFCPDTFALPPADIPSGDEPFPDTTSPCATTPLCLQLPCMHAFHYHCVTTWLSKSSTCPTCRRSAEMTVVPALEDLLLLRNQDLLRHIAYYPDHPSDLASLASSSTEVLAETLHTLMLAKKRVIDAEAIQEA